MYDWQKFWKHFRRCFIFESCVSTKTVVSKIPFNLFSSAERTMEKDFRNLMKDNSSLLHKCLWYHCWWEPHRRQRFDLSSPHTSVSWLSRYKAHVTNEYSWCNVLIFHPQALQTRSDFPSHCFNVNPIFHTALLGQHRSSLFALKVETNFLFQFDRPGFCTEL